MRRVVLLLCLLPVTGCGDSPTTPTSPLNTEFTLAAGEASRIEGEAITIRFVEVDGDSRCPADALCILGGSATVRITVASALALDGYELRTGDMQPVRHGRLTIRLVQLSPYPFSARPIEPGDYRATFTVTAS